MKMGSRIYDDQFKNISKRVNFDQERYHYNPDNDTIIKIQSMFFDGNHYFKKIIYNTTTVSYVDEEYVPLSEYGEYFKKYILEDLIYIGIITDENDIIYLRWCNDICRSKVFLNYINIFNHRYIKRKSEKDIFYNVSEYILSDLVKIKFENENKDKKAEKNKSVTLMKKRSDVIGWNNYFMGIAKLVRMRSKDPTTQVGACITRRNKILSTGYNGFPYGLDDDEYPWSKGDEDPTKNKYFYVVHAELNAILNSSNTLNGSTLYVTKFPCNECAKAIIQAGICNVIYDDDLSDDKLFSDPLVSTSRKMLTDAKVKCIRYDPLIKI